MQRHAHHDVVERLWNAIAGSESEILSELLDDKSCWRMSGRSPVAGTYIGQEEILQFLALVGELTTDLHAELLDVFVSDRGAVLRYSVVAERGSRRLETEQLLLLEIENDRITEAIFAPIDQAEYDRFFSPP